MSDLFDRASELEDLHRQASLDTVMNRLAHCGSPASHCDDCGEPIPPARLRVVPGCRRCVSCQEDAERGHVR